MLHPCHAFGRKALDIKQIHENHSKLRSRGCVQAALELGSLNLFAGKPISEERLQDCINVILSYQNAEGGWATYENTRSYPILEVRWNAGLGFALL